jgi:hypothetical protein
VFYVVAFYSHVLLMDSCVWVLKFKVIFMILCIVNFDLKCF